jgi:quercetin dioxygenase-like cupin family protein
MQERIVPKKEGAYKHIFKNYIKILSSGKFQNQMFCFSKKMRRIMIHNDQYPVNKKGNNILLYRKRKHMENEKINPLSNSNQIEEVNLQTFDLQSAIQKIKKKDTWKSGSRNSIQLLKTPELTIILLGIHKNTEIGTHQANGRISVQVLEGELEFKTDSESVILKKGGLLSLAKNTKHSLKATEETFFLLTKVNL